MNELIPLLLGAGLLAAITCLLALPLWRAWSQRIGLVDAPGYRKIHDKPIPLAGGLAILTGIVLPLAAFAAAVRWRFIEQAALDPLMTGTNLQARDLTAILFGAAAMTLLGWIDDKFELWAVLKFAGQLFVAIVVAANGIRITLFVPNLLFSYTITVLWIVTVTNALNFMDNMNGLCTGLAVIAALAIGLVSVSRGQPSIAALAFLTAGASLGFLPWNFPRASAFLGDAGSHLLGYLLAVMAILPAFHSASHPNRWAVVSPLLILAIPLIDLVWVVILRWRAGKPFYLGDTNHLSHRLVRLGLTRTQAVIAIWLLAAALGSFSLLL
jgi:UDP-GlcNAc:undecaprenyl-phosphate GlcNAc-1-phosphate transferase